MKGWRRPPLALPSAPSPRPFLSSPLSFPLSSSPPSLWSALRGPQCWPRLSLRSGAAGARVPASSASLLARAPRPRPLLQRGRDSARRHFWTRLLFSVPFLRASLREAARGTHPRPGCCERFPGLRPRAPRLWTRSSWIWTGGGRAGGFGGDESPAWGRLRLPGNGAAPPPCRRGSAALPAAPPLYPPNCPARRPEARGGGYAHPCRIRSPSALFGVAPHPSGQPLPSLV